MSLLLPPWASNGVQLILPKKPWHGQRKALEIETRREGRMSQRELLPSLPMALFFLSDMVALMAVMVVSLNSFDLLTCM